MDWLLKNIEWLFGGVGVMVIGAVSKILAGKVAAPNHSSQHNQSITINNQSSTGLANNPEKPHKPMSVADRKLKTWILFIDDDIKFKAAKILINSGWVNTSIIKDATTLEQANIYNAHILFVDIQGVGLKMGFFDEGLGLASAIKKKYPEKKVIIYSAETKGDRFHAALREADSFLPKNADPYEFQSLVDQFSDQLDFT